MGADRGAASRDHAARLHLGLEARRHLPRGIEVPLRLRILHELHGRKEPLPASNVPDVGVIAERSGKAREKTRSHPRGVLAEAFALHDLDVPERNRAAGWVTRIRVGMGPAVSRL